MLVDDHSATGGPKSAREKGEHRARHQDGERARDTVRLVQLLRLLLLLLADLLLLLGLLLLGLPASCTIDN